VRATLKQQEKDRVEAKDKSNATSGGGGGGGLKQARYWVFGAVWYRIVWERAGILDDGTESKKQMGTLPLTLT